MKVEISDETLRKVSKETLIKAWETANKPEPKKPEYVPKHGDFGESETGKICGAINTTVDGMKKVGDGRLLSLADFGDKTDFSITRKYFNAFDLLRQIQEAMGKEEINIENEDKDVIKVTLSCCKNKIIIMNEEDMLYLFEPQQARQVAAALLAKAIEVNNDC